VIVFSCFDGPIQKLAKELGAQAVVVTGKTPAAMRQTLVDRFQNDDASFIRFRVAATSRPDTAMTIEVISQLLRRASDEFRQMHRDDPPRPVAIHGEPDVRALARAFEALVKVPSGPSARRFRISSASHTGVDYEVVVVDADVACSCPGFEYRGQCRHARDVKTAPASGEPAPARYTEMSQLE
jgi:SWIM zinc finger